VHVLSSIAAVIVAGGLVVLSGALYLLPVLIGSIRRVPGLGSVAVINVLLGWTLIGWVAALALALRSARPHAAGAVARNFPAPPGPGQRNFPAPPGPGQMPGPGRAGPGWPPSSRPGVPPPLVLSPRPGGDRDNAGPMDRP
jgi:Superinfection immunity protein